MAKKSTTKFVDYADAVKGSMVKQQMSGLREAAKIVRGVSKKLVPVKSGRLRRAIATWVRKDRAGGPPTMFIGVYTSKKQKEKGISFAPHAHWIEFGTSKTKAHPFLTPAVHDNIKVIHEAIAKGMAGIEDKDEHKKWIKQQIEEAVEDD